MPWRNRGQAVGRVNCETDIGSSTRIVFVKAVTAMAFCKVLGRESERLTGLMAVFSRGTKLIIYQPHSASVRWPFKEWMRPGLACGYLMSLL